VLAHVFIACAWRVHGGRTCAHAKPRAARPRHTVDVVGHRVAGRVPRRSPPPWPGSNRRGLVRLVCRSVSSPPARVSARTDAVHSQGFNPLGNECIARAVISATWISTSSWSDNGSRRPAVDIGALRAVLRPRTSVLGTPPFRAQDEHSGRKHRFRHISLLKITQRTRGFRQCASAAFAILGHPPRLPLNLGRGRGRGPDVTGLVRPRRDAIGRTVSRSTRLPFPQSLH